MFHQQLKVIGCASLFFLLSFVERERTYITSCLLFCMNSPSQWGLLLKKKITLSDKHIISFTVDPIKKGDNLENGRVAFSESVSICLNFIFCSNCSQEQK